MPASIAFIIRPDRPEAINRAAEMESWFRASGVNVFYPQRGERSISCDMAITFGGDGTLLAGAAYALQYRCPLLGINLGTLGFLTEGDSDQMESMFQAILKRRYELESRSLLRVSVNDGPEELFALNDAVVTRGGFARLIAVETVINGEQWGSCIADGVIAATPTGSTGYSLSAGGPVVAPGMDCMVITPVCAHSLQHCPFVVPHGAEIIFRLHCEREQQAQLQVDGRNVCTLKAGDFVRVTGADEKLVLVRLKDYHFFEVLKEKLSEWSGAGKEEER